MKHIYVPAVAVLWTVSILLMVMGVANHDDDLGRASLLVCMVAWLPTQMMLVGYIAACERQKIIEGVSEVLGRSLAGRNLPRIDQR